jgi:hypothetical protein
LFQLQNKTKVIVNIPTETSERDSSDIRILNESSEVY